MVTIVYPLLYSVRKHSISYTNIYVCSASYKVAGTACANCHPSNDPAHNYLLPQGCDNDMIFNNPDTCTFDIKVAHPKTLIRNWSKSINRHHMSLFAVAFKSRKKLVWSIYIQGYLNSLMDLLLWELYIWRVTRSSRIYLQSTHFRHY